MVYARHIGIDDDMVDPFVIVIRAMDRAWLDWQADESERRRKQSASSTPQPGGGPLVRER